MKRLVLAAIFSGLLHTPVLAGLVPQIPNDPGLIHLGPKQSFYQISSDSGKWWDWGLVRAPVEEPTVFNHGYGTDAIAIPFDMDGRVTFAPIYIYTIRPETSEEALLGKLIQGVTTQNDVRRIYGTPIRAKVRGYEVWYYEIRVHNPFDDMQGGRGLR